jgi:membrane protein DedA with SNARE-associated domain
MSEQILHYIAHYGYLAILALVFLQEVGIPNPIPNEFLLLFSGYLSYTGVLNASLVVLAAVIGDLMASFLLFELFYFFGKTVMRRKPKWLPISEDKIEKLKQKIDSLGRFGAYVWRVTPFIKGYVSVICGLIKVPQKKYSFILVTTSLAWALVYVGGGYIAGPYFKDMALLNERHLFMLPALVMLVVIIIQLLKKKSIV